MEITCTRCHEVVRDDNRYCPACGLPQMVYSGQTVEGQAQPARWDEPVRDASSVDWKPALKAVLMLAVPAGLFSSASSPLSSLGIFWMASAAGWAVVLYMRSQRPAWITIGPARASAWLRDFWAAGWRLGPVAALYSSSGSSSTSPARSMGCIRPLSWILSSREPSSRWRVCRPPMPR